MRIGQLHKSIVTTGFALLTASCAADKPSAGPAKAEPPPVTAEGIERDLRDRQVRALLDDARRAEADGRWTDARDVYARAAAVDPGSAAAADGYAYALAQLGLGPGPAGELSATEGWIAARQQEVTYRFDAAVAECNHALGAGDLEAAGHAYDRAGAAAASAPGLVPGKRVGEFKSTLWDLRVRIEGSRGAAVASDR